MTFSNDVASTKRKMLQKYIVTFLGWAVLVGSSLAWNMAQLQRATMNTAAATIRSSLAKDIGFRNWAASHGGVYVPPTTRIPSNPYLKTPDRDVVTTTGKELTLMNPAYVIREVQQDFSGDVNIKSHLTSLNLFNPNNAPDEWEARALKSLEQGKNEVLEVSQIDNKAHLRLMLPLHITDGCLKCHDQQNYQVGDVRGGISASISLEPFTAVELGRGTDLILSHGLIWLMGILGMVVVYYREKLSLSERKIAEERIHTLAYYDDLTHLPNRHLLIDRLLLATAVSTRTGQSGAVLFFDLDHFKTLNETKGYYVGDLLLLDVAKRLSHQVQEGDSVARLGSDEFVVVLEMLGTKAEEAAAQARLAAEKLKIELGQPYRLKQFIHTLTPSIGIVMFNTQDTSPENLIKHAEVAMHQAKAMGRNTICFHDNHMQIVLEAHAEMESELRMALDKHQLHLYYQAQVDELGRVLGAEVLIRWIHPERGMVSPGQFIPLAEESDLILPIGQWVLNTACAQLKKWQGHALTRDLTLSVNVSAKQFHQHDFVAHVKNALQRYEVNPSFLKLEPTESLLLADIEGVIHTMKQLKALGVLFSLDDFGTGYSSLQYLKRLPLDQLKIDQSFVRNLDTDDNDKAIVKTIITMAHELNFDVIAEGVETKAQREILLEKGCQHFQGALFSLPVPLAQFEALLLHQGV